MEPIYSREAFDRLTAENPCVLLYFSTESCSVCKVLKPKVREMLKTEFPRMGSGYIDTDRSPLLAGQNRVFTIPTILLFFEGREHGRYSRNISLYQLEEAIRKPYTLLCGDEPAS